MCGFPVSEAEEVAAVSIWAFFAFALSWEFRNRGGIVVSTLRLGLPAG